MECARNITKNIVRRQQPHDTSLSSEAWIALLPSLPDPSMIGEPERTMNRGDRRALVHSDISEVADDAFPCGRSDDLHEWVEPCQATPSLSVPITSTAETCSFCKGAGYLRNDVPFGHPLFGKPVVCKCREAELARRRRQQLYDLSNLGAHHDKNLTSFNPHLPGVQEAYRAAREFAMRPDGWLVLSGGNGCGKTHLAAAIANHCFDQGWAVCFSIVPDMLDHLRATFAPTSSVAYDHLFSSMRTADLLVLDDLGAEQTSSWANEKLFLLFNYRYNSRLPMVITTNGTALAAVDERIRSRLQDGSLVRVVTLDRARDYRPFNCSAS
jgi:DNA replication protein DnaC